MEETVSEKFCEAYALPMESRAAEVFCPVVSDNEVGEGLRAGASEDVLDAYDRR